MSGFLCGFRESELRSAGLCSKHFTHWVVIVLLLFLSSFLWVAICCHFLITIQLCSSLPPLCFSTFKEVWGLNIIVLWHLLPASNFLSYFLYVMSSRYELSQVLRKKIHSFCLYAWKSWQVSLSVSILNVDCVTFLLPCCLLFIPPAFISSLPSLTWSCCVAPDDLELII